MVDRFKLIPCFGGLDVNFRLSYLYISFAVMVDRFIASLSGLQVNIR